MDRPHAGWSYADQLFGPANSYLRDEDKAMDWLHKVRALIGVAILVVAGIHYHHSTKSIVAYFNPVLGGVTEPMILALLFVFPATAAAVFFTRREKRDEAFGQMMRYPVKAALICLAAYGCILGLERLASTDKVLVYVIIFIIGIIDLRYFLFQFRATYLLTVGMCRLGDGHPLLPPIIGAVVAWAVACQSLLTDNSWTGAPAAISLAVLLGGPLSITALGHVEISRLRRRYPEEFPFRDGPLPSQDRTARAASPGSTRASTQAPSWHQQQADPNRQAAPYQLPEQVNPYLRTSPYQATTAPAGARASQPLSPAGDPSGDPLGSTRRRRYPLPLAIVSTIVPGIVLAAYALSHSASPAAVNTSISAIQDGQCIQYRPDPDVTTTSFPVIPCSAMHWGQVIGLISIGDAASTSYPGDDVASQESGAVCAKAFDEAFGSHSRGYSLWYAHPGGDGWNDNHGTDATCIAEAGDSMPYKGGLSQQPEPTSPTREKVKPVPLSAVSLAGNSGYTLGGNSTAAPYTWPITTASVLPPAPCGAATPSDDWLGSTGARAHYQLTQGKIIYGGIDVTVAPLTQAGQESLPDYLKGLPRSCYSPHWFSFQDGMHYTDDSAFTRPADGTRLLLDMGYGESGPLSYRQYWTVSDGYLLDFVYYPSAITSTSREPMDNALAAAVTHINSVLHTHLRA